MRRRTQRQRWLLREVAGLHWAGVVSLALGVLVGLAGGSSTLAWTASSRSSLGERDSAWWLGMLGTLPIISLLMYWRDDDHRNSHFDSSSSEPWPPPGDGGGGDGGGGG